MKKLLLAGLLLLSMTGFAMAQGHDHKPAHHPVHHKPVHHPVHHASHHKPVHHPGHQSHPDHPDHH